MHPHKLLDASCTCIRTQSLLKNDSISASLAIWCSHHVSTQLNLKLLLHPILEFIFCQKASLGCCHLVPRPQRLYTSKVIHHIHVTSRDSHMLFWGELPNSNESSTFIHLLFIDFSSASRIQHDFDGLIRGIMGLTVLGIALHKHCRMTPLGRCMNWRAHLWVFGVVVIWHCPSCRDVATVWNSTFIRTNHR